ncbi:MAG: hypothetical protein IKL49_01320 [Lachnospiraceae bacterium]|nr:hypothetical protein [Lachnospiraceae bacterium]
MERIKGLNRYQKGLFIFMIIMTLLFAIIYPMTISRVGYRYNDAILVPTQENGKISYTGKIQGKQAQFIVSENKSVMFQYGDKSYGTYTMIEDPTAIPQDKEIAEEMTGVEIRNGDKLLFRGGVWDAGDFYWLYNEDGTLDSLGFSVMTSNGIELDENGDVIDRMEPSASTIYELLNEPELTHKGEAQAWFGAVFICILNALTILFADELFRWNLAFQIRNVENAEPSDLEITGRYIGWTAMVIMALVLFIMGLQ